MSNPQIDYDRIADIYDLYVTADYDIPFFLSERTVGGGPVLELTAGTGRLSLPLVQAGVHLTCVDASQGMLAVYKPEMQSPSRSRLLDASPTVFSKQIRKDEHYEQGGDYGERNQGRPAGIRAGISQN